MTMSCKKASVLISEGMDRKLSLGERASLGFHLAMCRLCKLHKKQLEFISSLARRMGDAVMGDATSAVALSSEAKQRIKSRMSDCD